MTIAWGVLLPLGVMFSRFYRHVEPKTGPRAFWFVHHQIFQYTGVLLALIGFILALYMCRNKGHFVSTHARVGLAVMIMGLLQPLNAFIRPAPGGWMGGVRTILSFSG